MVEGKNQAFRTELTNSKGRKISKKLLLDENTVSKTPGHPSFVAPPEGSRPYYGFLLIDSLCMDGFRYGAVTDFLEPDSEDGCTIGDGFVEAPDGTRAGLFWEVGDDLGYKRIEDPDDNRWGVYYFTIPYAVRTTEDMKRAFEKMVPFLKELHKEANSR